jgi:hypothetical protein
LPHEGGIPHAVGCEQASNAWPERRGFAVPTPNTTGWVGLGLLLLPVYGVLTFIGTFTHQPDPNTDFEAYARYISTTSYLISHLGVSIFGTVLVIFGFIALAAYLIGGRAGRLTLFAMVTGVAGNSLILTIFGFSTFASPAIGHAYLEGQHQAVEINQAILGLPLVATALTGGLLYTASTILFGIAIWRSGTLPRWAGILFAPTGFLLSILGLIVGQSQTVGTALLIVATGWISWSVLRRSSTETVRVEAQPRVR